jgi:hypothetical protein
MSPRRSGRLPCRIDPIPTDAKGIVRGTTITLKDTPKRVKGTIDLDHSDNEKSESDMNPKCIEANAHECLGLC